MVASLSFEMDGRIENVAAELAAPFISPFLPKRKSVEHGRLALWSIDCMSLLPIGTNLFVNITHGQYTQHAKKGVLIGLTNASLT
jgi:hypothetical protein